MVLPTDQQTRNGIVVAVDVDNLLISFSKTGPGYRGYSLLTGFEKMFEWIQTFGKILSVHLYMPSSQSLNYELWHNLWEKYHKWFHFFEAIYCPQKTSDKGEATDNVDSHLIEHTRQVISLFLGQVKYFCLVSGDLDYSPLLWQLKREQNIEILFALGSERSFSSAYRQMEIAAKHPVTGEDLIYYFSPHKTV